MFLPPRPRFLLARLIYAAACASLSTDPAFLSAREELRIELLKADLEALSSQLEGIFAQLTRGVTLLQNGRLTRPAPSLSPEDFDRLAREAIDPAILDPHGILSRRGRP